MLEVMKIPPRYAASTKLVRSISLAVHFHSHDSEDINDQTQYESDVSNGADTVSDCGKQLAHSLP